MRNDSGEERRPRRGNRDKMAGALSKERLRVLLIEDDAENAVLIREMLAEAEGGSFDVQCAECLSAALARLVERGTDVVLLDLGLPDSSGIDTFVDVHVQAPDTPILVLTGLDDESVGLQAAREGAEDYLVKGQVSGNMLARAIRHALERKSIEKRMMLERRVLGRLNQPHLDMAALGSVLTMVGDGLGLDRMGLRLRLGEDWPFHVSFGLSEAFLESANYLCARDDAGEMVRDRDGNPVLACLCGAILSRRTDASLPHFTEAGTFWCNSCPDLMEALPRVADCALVRDCCPVYGFESAALVPVRSKRSLTAPCSTFISCHPAAGRVLWASTWKGMRVCPLERIKKASEMLHMSGNPFRWTSMALLMTSALVKSDLSKTFWPSTDRRTWIRLSLRRVCDRT